MKHHELGFALALVSVVGACTPSTPHAEQPAPSAPAPTPETSAALPAGSGGAGGAANASGAGVANGGTTEKMCGGIAAIACPPKQYCSYAPEARCGASDMSGTCAPVPDACTLQLDEVCGCDDKTYGNACAAAQAGVSVAMKGPCAKSPPPNANANAIAEGGLCGTRGVQGECAAGLYCAYKSQCGATDTGGLCTKRPSMCTKIYSPVCGCDGKTYASGCTAAVAGVSVARQGECKP